jgi:predicted RNase H-like HicB family nuclease
MIPYSMLIRWSEDDQLFLVTFPELTGFDVPQTHGRTYEEAARQGQEALESLIDGFREWNITLPPPSLIRVEDLEFEKTPSERNDELSLQHHDPLVGRG